MGLFGPPNVQQLKAKRDVQGLFKALGYQKDWHVRASAAQALGELGDRHAVEPLIASLKESDGNVQQAAAQALGQLGDTRAVEPLIASLEFKWMQPYYFFVQRAAVQALGKLKDRRAVDPLIALINIKSRQNEVKLVQRAAAEALGNFGDSRAMEPLIVLLKDIHASAFIRVEGPSGDFQADNDLLKALARALGQIGDARTVEPLLSILKAPAYEPGIGLHSDSKNFLTTIVEEAVTQIRDSRAVKPLTEALKDNTPNPKAANPFVGVLTLLQMRQVAARALGNLGDIHAVEPLIEALKDSNMELRQIAVEALGKLGDTRAVEPLIALLEDSDAKDKVQEQIKASRDMQAQAGGPTYTAVVLSPSGDLHAEWELWRISARVLGELRDPRAVPPLVKLTSDGQVAEAAIEALQRTVEHTAAGITTEDLRSVLHLDNVVQLHPGGSMHFPGDYSKAVDCSQVKLLAQQELIRRGLAV